jgi:hypothetical protein
LGVIIPRSERAFVDEAKLRDYCLNPKHPRGRHKVRVFASALDLSQSDAGWLKSTLLEAVQTINSVGGETDAYGSRYTVDFVCTKGKKTAKIRSAWILRTNEAFPEFLSCYVLS